MKILGRHNYDDVDSVIREELRRAGAEAVTTERGDGDVPYMLIGVVGDWGLTRAWSYWVASAQPGTGLPLDIANELHTKAYLASEQRISTYGQVVRVAGYSGGAPPDDHVTHYDSAGLELVVDPTGQEEREYREMALQHAQLKKAFEACRFVPSLDGVVARSVIDLYHIDTQEGLNEFVRTVRDL